MSLNDKYITDVIDQSDLIDCVDILTYNRPLPQRIYDQIYMKARYMLDQIEYVKKYLVGKKIAFLGDGDGMSTLIALLSNWISWEIVSMSVFDFDERILKSYERIRVEHKLFNIPISYHLYNIINPVRESERKKFDFFYINPPYGSKNGGLSCMMWLYRCMDLCTEDAEGCIIIPDDESFLWSVECTKNIVSFLNKYGFEVVEHNKNIHQYHLQDNPTLKSSYLLVKRIKNISSPYEELKFPISMCKNLYGSPRAIPQYIYEDFNNPNGHQDFCWEYGNEDNFLN